MISDCDSNPSAVSQCAVQGTPTWRKTLKTIMKETKDKLARREKRRQVCCVWCSSYCFIGVEEEERQPAGRGAVQTLKEIVTSWCSSFLAVPVGDAGSGRVAPNVAENAQSGRSTPHQKNDF